SGGAAGDSPAASAPSRAGGSTQCAPERPRRFSLDEFVSLATEEPVYVRQTFWPLARPVLVSELPRTLHQPTADRSNRRRRPAGLYRHLLTEILDVEIGMHFFAERESDVRGRREPGDQDAAIGDHFLGRAGCVDERVRCVALDFARGTADPFVRVQFEDQWAAVRNSNGLRDKCLAVLTSERLANI